MVSSLGGPKDFCDKYDSYLPQAAIIKPVLAQTTGYVASMHTRDIGLSLIKLKGGRTRSDQKLDFATGFSNFCQIGDKVEQDTPLAYIHAQTQDECEQAAEDIRNAVLISSDAPQKIPEIIEKIA